MTGRSRVERFYGRGAERYHRAMSSASMRRMLRRSREEVGELVRGRLLDVGFGTGLSLPHYPPSVSVVGLDLSRHMLLFGRAAAEGRPVSLVQADSERLPFADRSFDSVAFNLCLCTIPDPEAAIRDALRVARPGAPIVFLEHVRSHLLPVALLQDLVNPATVLLQADHFNRRTERTARRAGVEIVRVERWLLGVFTLIVGRAPGPDGLDSPG